MAACLKQARRFFVKIKQKVIGYFYISNGKKRRKALEKRRQMLYNKGKVWSKRPTKRVLP
jgi:hypothetical protein